MNYFSSKEQKRNRHVQRRMAWSAPTEIKETRRAEGAFVLDAIVAAKKIQKPIFTRRAKDTSR
ncbi:MAG: hypothetical protein ACQEXB_18825 [Bacillota bacterium]